MKVFNQWLNALVFAVLVWQSNGISMEEVCKFWHEAGYIGDSRSCQGWGFCKNNTLVARGYCPEGYSHDAQSGYCQLLEVARCAHQEWENCALVNSGEFIADPFDCRRYKKCNDDRDDEEVNTCPDGNMYNNRLQTCVSSAGGCPQKSLDLCAYLPSGTTVGDPLNCGLFLECNGGSGPVKVCSASRFYNYKTGRCETVQPTHCAEDDYKPVKKEPPGSDANVCANYYQSDRSGNQFISDALTCHGYFNCNNQNSIAKWHSCPLGTHFQWWSQKCVLPDLYSCPFDRCGNINSTFVTVINTGCTEYIFCKNQVSYRLLKCPEDYPYFDEKFGVCGNKFPNYTICFMAG